ncbi:MAG: choice-of-anchor Q domain-containing protein [Solirubrobacterales bacterium]
MSVGGPGVSWSVVDSTIEGNTATGYVGGLGGKTYGDGLIEGSTIAGNIAAEGTGGTELAVETGGSVALRNSTIAENTTGEDGGGLAAFVEPGASVGVEGTTIAGNIAGSTAGGIEYDGPAGALSLTDTIVAGNTAGSSGPDLESTDEGPATAFSLIGDPSASMLSESVPGSDLLGVDPQLGPLADNGGPTETMALPPTSPAVNKGGGALTTDQRGDPRPVVYPGVALAAAPGADGADIGAYELQAPPSVVPPPPPPPAAKGPLRVRVSCPKSAKPGGCKFKLQVVSAKPKRIKGKLHKPKPESKIARVKLGAGKTALLTLKPKPKFAAKLDAAKKLLVHEVETIKGETRTAYRRLKVIG